MPIDARSVPAHRLLTEAPGPPRFLAAGLAASPRLRHGFFGREGGVSEGAYASLNTAPHSGDHPDAIRANRVRVAAALGVECDQLVTLAQVHSPLCVTVEGPFKAAAPEADALVTATPGLALGVLTADCAPVLFADPHAGVIGAAHAGWKGAAGGVLQACIAAMRDLGAQPARIVAAIGPCIRQSSYEVGPELAAAVCAQNPGAEAFFRAGQGDRLAFDLPGFCAQALAGLKLGRVETLPFDTYSDETAFFSFRRATHDGARQYGRQASAIMLNADD
jgi:polyphenol oxidase